MKIYWDYENKRFLTGLATSQTLETLKLALRDLVAVQLYLVTFDSTTNAWTVGNAPAGWTPRFALKAAGGFDGQPLAGQGSWTASGVDLTRVYTADLDLNTVALIAAVGLVAYVDLFGEFTLQDAGGRNRDSSLLACRVYADVNRAEDAAAAPAVYARLEEFVQDGQECIRFVTSKGVVLLTLTPEGVV